MDAFLRIGRLWVLYDQGYHRVLLAKPPEFAVWLGVEELTSLLLKERESRQPARPETKD